MAKCRIEYGMEKQWVLKILNEFSDTCKVWQIDSLTEAGKRFKNRLKTGSKPTLTFDENIIKNFQLF